MDVVNHGHKDAYSNAIIYRGWRCLADLELKLHRANQHARYEGLADRLKRNYRKVLYNTVSGWIADWRSEDGKLHDYASPFANGLAVEYGLVEVGDGRRIIERLWAKMSSVGFRRFELGIPLNLTPIPAADYMQNQVSGAPPVPNWNHDFQQYQNGGISAAQSPDFLVATYLVGRKEVADNVLRQMLARQQKGSFQNGVQNAFPKGIDWVTWDGKPCGYEGYLADVYYFLMAVLLREPAMRQRFLRPLFEVTAPRQ
jgi:hypothetical protein